LKKFAERPQYEFRGFANNKKLNALTMYCCFAYSEELHRRKKEVEKIILKFYDSIKDKIDHTAYVIDFFVMSDNTVKIIELNPFHVGAGAGLFTWKDHRNLFLNGPFEFRITESLPDDVHDITPIKWQKWIAAKFGPSLDYEDIGVILIILIYIFIRTFII